MLSIKSIENLGSNVIAYSVRSYDFLRFLFSFIAQIFSFHTYSKISFSFLIKQIYLSSIKHIFAFVFTAFFLGSLLIVLAISFAINFSFQEQIGDLLVLFVINEFSPFFTALFFILTYCLVAEERIQQVKNESKDLISEVYLAKILSVVFMLPLMALLFASIMIISGYFVSTFYLNIDLFTYKNLITNSIGFENILVLFLKSLAFAFVSIFIPIYYGHNKQRDNLNVTKTVLKILIVILTMLLLIEFFFILVFY